MSSEPEVGPRAFRGDKESGEMDRDPLLLDRRQLLCRGGRAIVGIALLAGVEVVLAPPVRGQGQQSGIVVDFQFMRDFTSRTGLTGIKDDALFVCRHLYRFGYRPGSGNLEMDLQRIVRTSRVDPRFNKRTTFLVPTVRTAPFPSFEEYKSSIQPSDLLRRAFPPPPPFPDVLRPLPEPTDDLRGLLCFRLIQRRDAQTFDIFDWCSLYAYSDSRITIEVGR